MKVNKTLHVKSVDLAEAVLNGGFMALNVLTRKQVRLKTNTLKIQLKNLENTTEQTQRNKK